MNRNDTRFETANSVEMRPFGFKDLFNQKYSETTLKFLKIRRKYWYSPQITKNQNLTFSDIFLYLLYIVFLNM